MPAIYKYLNSKVQPYTRVERVEGRRPKGLATSKMQCSLQDRGRMPAEYDQDHVFIGGSYESSPNFYSTTGLN